jgi:hypothetical protein
MSAADETTTPAAESAPRSTGAVLGIIGAIIALPLVLWLLFSFGGGSGATGAADLEDGVDTDRIQAVYLANDRVFFGKLEAGEGDFVELHDAYFLRAKAAEQAKDGEEAAVTSLIPVEQEVGGDGTLVVNSSEIVLAQNLTSGSPIAKEIEKAGS